MFLKEIFINQKGNCLISKLNINKGIKLFEEKLFIGVKLTSKEQEQEQEQEERERDEKNNFVNIKEKEKNILERYLYINERYYACILIIRIIEKIRNNKQYEDYFNKNIFRINNNNNNNNKRIQQLPNNLLNEIEEIQNIINYYFNSIILPLSIITNIKLYIDFVLRNTFTITNFELNPIGFGIYLRSSKFNHSCEPNLFHYFDTNTGKIFLQTIKNIKLGEELCISYIDVGQSTTFRRYELMNKYNFNCMCSKCCIIDHLDCWKCSQTKCDGLLSISLNYHKLIYSLWLNPMSQNSLSDKINYLLIQDTLSKLSSSLYYPDTSSILYLYSWINSSNLPLSYFEKYSLFYECNKCSYQYSIQEIIQTIHEIYQLKKKIIQANERKNTKYITYQQSLWKLLLQKIPNSNYIIFDTGSILSLSLINYQRYEEALQFNIQLTSSLLHCYSFYSPVILIQFYQIMKLYLYLGNELLAHKYRSWIMSIMKVLYGENHPLTLSIV